MENDKKIIESDEYKERIPFYRKENPGHIYSEYNLINHSKVNFLRHTKDLYPDYKFYAWIDFGSMNYDINNIPKNININLLYPKIIYKCIVNPTFIRPDAYTMLASNDIYFLGSSFIVHKDLVNKFESLYEDKIIEWHEKKITDDDQNLVLQLYYDNPELFQIINHPKWFGMYLALQ